MATVDRYVLEIETDKAEKGLDRVKGGMTGVSAAAGRLRGAIVPLAGALAGIGAINVIGNKINEMDDLAKAAREAGAAGSNEAFKGFQAMSFAMSEAGVDAGTFNRAMLQTTNRLQKGIEGQKSFAEITDKLGDSIRTSNGELKSGPELLQAMINALNEGRITTDEFAKVVGGRAGPVIQAQFASLNTTAEALATTLAEAGENADIIDLEAANNAEVFNDNIGRLKENLNSLLTDAITPLLPHLVRFSEEILANMPGFIEGVKEAFDALEPVLSLIATVFSEILVPVLQTMFEVLGFIAEAITPLVESAIPALQAGFEGLAAIVETVIGFFQSTIELLGTIGEKAVALKDNVTGAFGNMKDSVVEKTGQMYDGVTGWFDGMYDYVVGNSVVPDMVKGVLGEFDLMNSGLVQTMSNIFNNVTSYFNDILNTVRQKTAGIRDALSGVGSRIGGGVSNTFGGISDFFAGFFANGGFIPGGKFGVVGERGAELVSGPAQVTPLNGLGGVTYNINAVDVNSFQNLLARDPGYLHALVQKGAAGIPGGRR